MREARVVVIGLGGIGSAATYWLSRQLSEGVVGIEQYRLGHLNGGSEDHSRIIRLSYHTPEYVRLAAAAYEAWGALETDAGEKIVLRTGGLDLAPEGAAIGLDDYRSSMTSEGVAFEELSSDDVMARWPQWRLPDDTTALYQSQSGIVAAGIANQTHRLMAREHGADLAENQQVIAIDETPDGVHVTTDTDTFQCEKLVVAAGAWTAPVLSNLGVHLPLEVTQEQVVYFRPREPGQFHPERFPIWIWMTVPSFYGFPVFGEPAVKVAWDRCEVVTTPETRSHEPVHEVTETIGEFVQQHLPDAYGAVHLARTCLYTLTPDRDFIVDRVPGMERVFMAVGAGHAFKFASLLGRILADLVVDGSTSHDISGFRADRAVLKETNPARSYMV